MSGLSLEASATRCGGHCWAERSLFATLGAAAAAGPPPVAVVLDRLAQHAAWRAGQWWERLPVLADVDREDLVVAPPGWRALRAEPAADVLVDVAHVALPALAVAYARHLEVATGPADASVRRTLTQVASDVAGDWVAACRVLEDLATGAATLP